METDIYVNDGKNIETKLLNLGSALKYAKNQDDLIEQYDINFESIASHNHLRAGTDINKIDILFKKIEKKDD